VKDVVAVFCGGEEGGGVEKIGSEKLEIVGFG